MDLDLIIIALIFLIFTLFLFVSLGFKSSPPVLPSVPKKKKGVLHVCPICGHRTGSGERVYAQYLDLPDGRRRVEIQGCDFCIPKQRSCPRCHNVLKKNEIVFALLLPPEKKGESTAKKDRLHIEGCMNCYKR